MFTILNLTWEVSTEKKGRMLKSIQTLSFNFSFSCMPCLPNAQFAHLYNALGLWLYHEKGLFCLLIFTMRDTFLPPHMGGLALPLLRHLSQQRTPHFKHKMPQKDI